MDIDTMPAGRDMDRLIALLMGWSDIRVLSHSVPPYVEGVPPDIKERGLDYQRTVPHYSTEIAAAWTILPQLDNRVTIYGPGAPFAGDEYRNDGPLWRVEGDVGSVYGETAPLALCRYALKATGYPG